MLILCLALTKKYGQSHLSSWKTFGLYSLGLGFDKGKINGDDRGVGFIKLSIVPLSIIEGRLVFDTPLTPGWEDLMHQ